MQIETLSSNDSKVIHILLDQLHTYFPGSISQIILFGSKARGDDTDESDIDILVVTHPESGDLKTAIRKLAAKVSFDWNVVFNIFPYTQERWDWMASVRHPLWRSITEEGIDLTPELSRP